MVPPRRVSSTVLAARRGSSAEASGYSGTGRIVGLRVACLGWTFWTLSPKPLGFGVQCLWALNPRLVWSFVGVHVCRIVSSFLRLGAVPVTGCLGFAVPVPKP